MGTYIYPYVEYDTREKGEPFSDSVHITSLTEKSFSTWWEYDVFDALGYGRAQLMSRAYRTDHLRPLFRPLGIPPCVSLAVARDYFELVVPRGKKPDKYFWSNSACVSERVALRRRARERCRFHTVVQSVNTGGAHHISWRALPKSCYYNASWLSPMEYRRALAHHRLSFRKIGPEFSILNSAMSILENARGKDRVRLVFWFC